MTPLERGDLSELDLEALVEAFDRPLDPDAAVVVPA